MFLGDKNTVTLARALNHEGLRYLPGDSVTVDSETAKRLVENGYGEVTSMEWDKPQIQHGQAVEFRKRK